MVRRAERQRRGHVVSQLSQGGWSKIGAGSCSHRDIAWPYRLSLSPQIAHSGSGRLSRSGPGRVPDEWCLLTLQLSGLGELGGRGFSLWSATAFALQGRVMTRMETRGGVWSLHTPALGKDDSCLGCRCSTSGRPCRGRELSQAIASSFLPLFAEAQS